MRMDETQRGWLIASAAILAVALAVFVPYAYFSSQGPRGGSAHNPDEYVLAESLEPRAQVALAIVAAMLGIED